MSVSYKMITWDRQKKLYDLMLVTGLIASIGAFSVATVLTNPTVTAETLIIRGTAIAAITLLHVILVIGPLCRLNKLFLPIHYNRRHLGVTMFMLALVHAVFSIIQYHAFGDTIPLITAFTAYGTDYIPTGSLGVLPFEIFGAFALVILFLMAATSHDFWLKNLGASWWKMLHLMVYFAYGSVLVHVAFGILQSETHPVLPVIMAIGFVTIVSLHLVAAAKERHIDRQSSATTTDEGFIPVCSTRDLKESCASVAMLNGERIAVWLHEGKVFATSNVCRHQAGPVGEGRVIDGCITCPWHGWNYKVEDGVSPPPFREVLPTYKVRIQDNQVLVHPEQNPPATNSDGVLAGGTA